MHPTISIRKLIELLQRSPDLDKPIYVLNNNTGEPLKVIDLDFKDEKSWIDHDDSAFPEYSDCYPLIIVEE